LLFQSGTLLAVEDEVAIALHDRGVPALAVGARRARWSLCHCDKQRGCHRAWGRACSTRCSRGQGSSRASSGGRPSPRTRPCRCIRQRRRRRSPSARSRRTNTPVDRRCRSSSSRSPSRRVMPSLSARGRSSDLRAEIAGSAAWFDAPLDGQSTNQGPGTRRVAVRSRV
jgi:hypothetical protein